MKVNFSMAVGALCAATIVLPAVAAAEGAAIEATREDSWQFAGLIYVYYPDINTRATFPNGGSTDVTVDASDLFSNLRFGMLGSFEARKGQWGLFTDLIYMDAGAFRSRYHNLDIGHIGIPADVSASVNFDFKSTIWTLAGTYRVISTPDGVMDFYLGARLLDIKEELDWTLNGNIGQIPAPGRAGTKSVKDNYVDAVVGLKGRVALGAEHKWFIPYLADIGTGQTNLTWQAMTGFGYAFNWGEIIGGWRYLDYQFKSDSNTESMNLNGPLLGVAFHW